MSSEHPVVGSSPTLITFMETWQTWCMRRTENPENEVRLLKAPQLLRCSPAATRADCKSAAIRLRGFESLYLNETYPLRDCNMESVAQLEERQFVALVVAGSNPVGLPIRFNSIVVVQFTCNEQVVGSNPA